MRFCYYRVLLIIQGVFVLSSCLTAAAFLHTESLHLLAHTLAAAMFREIVKGTSYNFMWFAHTF